MGELLKKRIFFLEIFTPFDAHCRSPASNTTVFTLHQQSTQGGSVALQPHGVTDEIYLLHKVYIIYTRSLTKFKYNLIRYYRSCEKL